MLTPAKIGWQVIPQTISVATIERDLHLAGYPSPGTKLGPGCSFPPLKTREIRLWERSVPSDNVTSRKCNLAEVSSRECAISRNCFSGTAINHD